MTRSPDAPTEAPALAVVGVTHRYDDHLTLDGVTFEVAPGKVCALLGRNGAGKTTLISMVTGLLRPDGGSITLFGTPVGRAGPDVRRRVGFAPQEVALYRSLTTRENLVAFGELYGLRGGALTDRIEAVTATFELEDVLDRLVQVLSGGERRRVHSAVAVMHRPALLLLDEPTAGVDVETRSRLLAAVRRLADEDRTAVVYTTHYLSEVEELGAHVVILDAGRVVASGSVEELVGAHGRGAVELTFDGPAPAVAGAASEGNRLRLVCDRPVEVLSSLLRSIGAADAHRVVDVDLVTPGLEGVFLALTGSRYAEADR